MRNLKSLNKTLQAREVIKNQALDPEFTQSKPIELKVTTSIQMKNLSRHRVKTKLNEKNKKQLLQRFQTREKVMQVKEVMLHFP
jgi:hypothetical protein